MNDRELYALSGNKPTTTEQSCSTCNAFHPNITANPKSGEERQGWCRAKSPGLVTVTTPTGPGSFGAWPTVGAKQWCREYEAEDD